MSGYLEVKIRTAGDIPEKFSAGLLDEIATVLKAAGHSGSVKCTNTKQEVKFEKPETKPKLKAVRVEAPTDEQ